VASVAGGKASRHFTITIFEQAISIWKSAAQTPYCRIFMIPRAIPRQRALHVSSALIACALPIVILCSGRLLAIYLEQKTIHTTAPKDFFIKNQGLAFERAAARAPDILLLYGSSELIDPVPNRASDFFSTEPTGFQVCPVGRPGTTSLIILQKLGALGSDLHGRKIAVSLSPSWFLRPAIRPDFYAGSFSLPAASRMLFGHALDWNLKTEIAKRMLQFPDTLEKGGILELAATCFASGRPLDRIVLIAIWPLGKLQNALLDLQDHFEALTYILGRGRAFPHWLRLFSLHRAQPKRLSHDTHRLATLESLVAISPANDAAFRTRVAAANEWIDLELLFRTIRELRARTLILSMPLDPYAARGVSRSAHQVYYDKVRELAQRYHLPLIEFEDHDADPDFLIAHREHPTPKGWMYYNRALDDFFHKAQ
jgi:D-alanine transfer protein